MKEENPAAVLLKALLRAYLSVSSPVNDLEMQQKPEIRSSM